jgi:hypothetical protein
MTFREEWAEGPEDAPAYDGARVVCGGWLGIHTNTRVLSEGSEPVSHGMCPDCERAFVAEYGLDAAKGELISDPSETAGHPMSAPSPAAAPVIDHEGSEVPKPGAGAAALEALRSFPCARHVIATEDWPFTTLKWQQDVVRWWIEIARPIVEGP